TMATIASTAGVSRQTLYRYYPDIDAVLVGVAELIASHDDHLETHVRTQSGPAAQLDTLVHSLAQAAGHDKPEAAALRSTLPPAARDVLARHEGRVTRLLVDVLQTGIGRGVFRADLEPASDAPLLLGLAAAADPTDPERALTLVHRIIKPEEKPT
ncbi:MAG: TetR/AcrR family transcriptional regulator, partial [Acidimicrobiales bacterium]|nr:TetR/AcrR family transcriptional regulator [Acidimicrobiales bacterium]